MTEQSSDWLDKILEPLNCRNDIDGSKFDQRRYKGVPPKAKQTILSKTKEQVLELLPKKKHGTICGSKSDNSDICNCQYDERNGLIDQMKDNIEGEINEKST